MSWQLILSKKNWGEEIKKTNDKREHTKKKNNIRPMAKK